MYTIDVEHIMSNLSLFVFLAGFIIGLGAVTVIDVHGFLARKSSYWTEATIRAHKVTKPLIWLGMILAILGGVMFYWGEPMTHILIIHGCLALLLIINGYFLSYKVSPFLLNQEKLGKADEILPDILQRKIMISMIFSVIGWWGGLLLLVIYLGM